jgi:hypothetical protein
MQIENDYDKEVYNGDIGHIYNVAPDAGEIVVSFDGRSITYGFGELDILVPAYAATIHKSQGSEYPAVITCGLGALEDPADIDAGLTIRIPKVGRVAHQAARFGNFAL